MNAKTILVSTTFVVLTVCTLFSVLSYIYYVYNDHVLLNSLKEETQKFSNTLTEAKACLSYDKNIMTGDDELSPLMKIIVVNDERITVINKELQEVTKLSENEEHKQVISLLSAPDSPINRVKQYESEVRSKVINYCNTKRQHRDKVVRNEWTLKARLKKPIPRGLVERPAELSDVPNDLYSLIPLSSTRLTKELSGLDACLNNSLGVNLLKHKSDLERTQRLGRTEAVKKHAEMLYKNALEHYTRVRAANDALSVFYRAETHDGKYSTDDYIKLLRSQAEPLHDISEGDKSLNELTSYVKEIRTQYFVFVSSHSRVKHTFSHVRPKTSINSDGELDISLETYETDGYEYYYTLTRVSTSERFSEKIKAGELDSLFLGWDYKQNEMVGWVREWKRLYEDNSTIVKGWERDLHPKIEFDQWETQCEKPPQEEEQTTLGK